MSRPARILVGLTVLAMIFAGGAVGYGIGYERGSSAISAPPEPLPRVRPPSNLGVPNVTGESLEDAAERLAGLEFDVGFRQPPTGEGTGRVVMTEPEPGTIVERGTLIVVFEERVDGELPEVPGALEDAAEDATEDVTPQERSNGVAEPPGPNARSARP
ncbi:MAG: PASTA domain-containing protein [Acidimicrobiia bacterium]|nr:PASTA domain-containing protein [Acidimicrobiia bacterium]